MATLNVELINSLTESGESVVNYIENENSKSILNGAEITGDKAEKVVAKLTKYLDKNGSKAKIITVAGMIDLIAKRNGKTTNVRAKIEAGALTSEEKKQWADDLAKSDDNFHKAFAKVEDARACRKTNEIVNVTAENMHIVDAQDALIFMDASNCDVSICEGKQYTREECEKKLNENKPLTSTEKSVLFRQRNKELGRTEMRGIIATDAEQKILKKLCRDKLKEMRKDS